MNTGTCSSRKQLLVNPTEHAKAAMQMGISEARKMLNSMDYLLSGNRVVIVTRHGKPTFAIISVDYFESLTETIEMLSDANTMSLFKQGTEDVKNGRLIDHADVVAELG